MLSRLDVRGGGGGGVSMPRGGGVSMPRDGGRSVDGVLWDGGGGVEPSLELIEFFIFA